MLWELCGGLNPRWPCASQVSYLLTISLPPLHSFHSFSFLHCFCSILRSHISDCDAYTLRGVVLCCFKDPTLFMLVPGLPAILLLDSFLTCGAVPGIKLLAWCLEGSHSTPELHPQNLFLFPKRQIIESNDVIPMSNLQNFFSIPIGIGLFPIFSIFILCD